MSDITTLKSKITKATALANELSVTDQPTLDEASELRSKLKQTEKTVTELKNQVLKPLNEAVKAERARWSPIEDDIEQAVRIVNGKMIAYANKIESEAREAEAKLRKQVEAGQIKKPETIAKKMDAIEQAPTQVKTDNGGSTFKTVRKVRVVDNSLIPDKYWVLDEVAIRKDALAGIEIAGVEVYEDKQVSGF